MTLENAEDVTVESVRARKPGFPPTMDHAATSSTRSDLFCDRSMLPGDKFAKKLLARTVCHLEKPALIGWIQPQYFQHFRTSVK